MTAPGWEPEAAGPKYEGPTARDLEVTTGHMAAYSGPHKSLGMFRVDLERDPVDIGDER